jgi:PKD repeat protein
VAEGNSILGGAIMRKLKIYSWIMFIVAMLVSSGCTGGREFQDPSSGASSPAVHSFPPPSALHSASYTQEDLDLWGAEYSNSLPSNKVWRRNEQVEFVPTAAAGGRDLADMAYAIYQFKLDGYDLEPSLRFTWTKTQDFANAWVGLADYERDRWEWHALPAAGCLAFNAARNISAAGEMHAIVLCAGDDSWQLKLLRVGPESAPPAVLLYASPQVDNAPLPVDFDASGTFDPDGGSITKFEWDWEGDGVFDADTGVTPTALHVYAEVGTYPATLRVTDDENATSLKIISIQAMSYSCDPDTLYAIPLETQVAVGKPVRIFIATGQPVSPLQFMECVTLSFGQCGTYVPDSYNIGSPGGGRTDTDGYWALLGPPLPDDDYLDLPSKVPGTGSLPGEGLNYLTLTVVPMGPHDGPATIGNGAILCNLHVSFSQPGTYPLRFVQYIESKDMTHYTSADCSNHHWTLDESYSIVVE